jgi:hypothetical protein
MKSAALLHQVFDREIGWHLRFCHGMALMPVKSPSISRFLGGHEDEDISAAMAPWDRGGR